MKCNVISPTRKRQHPFFPKARAKTAAGSRGYVRGIEVLESRIAPATFLVLNTNDNGAGSLRQAILDANATPNSGGADLISFASISTGAFVIQPITELPAISEAVIIDGYTAPGTSQNTASIGTNAVLRVELSGAFLNSGNGLILGVVGGDPVATGGSTVRGLVINDFLPSVGDTGNGILIQSNDNKVEGSFLGTTTSGNAALGNSNSGVSVSHFGGTDTYSGNVIGGPALADRNLISGNALGISLHSAAMNTLVTGNLIGTDASGINALGNTADGILVDGAVNATIGGAGAGNVISGNKGAGISVTNAAAGIRISGNSIYQNKGLGIDLVGGTENFFGVTANDNLDSDTGPNGLTNSPTITNFNNTGANVMLDFSISAQPATNYRIEFFALTPGQVDLSGSGEGAVFLGSQDVTTNGAGRLVGNYAQIIVLPVNSFFTATITDVSAGQTSEFSPAMGTVNTYTWSGATSTDWFNPLNWSPNSVPGAFDTAIYNGGANPIQLNADASVLVFQHGAGAMQGTGELFVRNSLSWVGGSQDGPSLVLVDSATGSLNGSAGPLVWSAGNFTVAGTLTIGGSGLALNAGQLGVHTTGAVALNAGIFDQDGVNTPSSVSNAGKIEKFGSGAFGLDTTTVDNNASIESHAGALTLTGYTGFSGSKLGLTGGNIQTGGTLTLNTDGEIFGTGTITGNLVNNGGYVNVGIGEVTGILNLTGAYTQSSSGTLVVDLRGTTAGTNYDQFAVGGTASISGVLNVTILPGYTPALGNTLNVLTSTALTGTFFAVVGEGAFATNYTATNAQLVRSGLTYTWDAGGGADTNWFNSLNWSPDGLPGTSDAAILNSIATITIDTGDATVGDFSQSNGTLTGLKALNIIGSFSWTGGTQSGTGTTHPGAESSTVLNGAAKTLDTRTLFVQGSGVANGASALVLNNSALVKLGGLFEILNTTPFQSGGSGGTVEVRPESTLRKSGASSATIPAGLTFTENGLLEVLGGTFTILADGSASGPIFRVAPGNTLNFNSSVGFTLASIVSFEGGGTFALIGGTLNGSIASVTVAANTTFAVSGGIFSASSMAFTSNGPMQWSGGSLTGSATAVINGAFDISGSAAKTLSQWALNITSTSVGSWAGTGNISVLQNAVINLSGTVDILSAIDVLDGDSTGTMNVFTAGTFRKNSAGTSEVQIPFTNAGFVTSINGGTLQFGNSYVQGGGSLSVTSGSFIAAISPLQINAGLVSGNGTISGAVTNSGGLVSPGNGLNNAGTLVITGNYIQGGGGELFIEAQSTTAGSGYDQLQVGGTAALDGKLTFVTFNGYNAVAPATFDVITSTSALSGTFATTNLPPNGTASYAANSANVAFSPAGLIVNGTAGDDTLVLSVQAAVAGYTLNGGAFTALGVVSGFVFNAGAGNDTLLIDFTNGNPIPVTNGVSYNGEGESGGLDDKLMITGGAQGTVSYNFGNSTTGNVVMSNFGTVNFASITPITNSGGATDVIFNLPNVTNAATLGDDGTAANTLSRLSGATLPQTDFANPTTSLTIHSLSGADTLTISALPDFSASLDVSPFSGITLSGAVTLAAGNDFSVAASSVNTTATGAIAVSGAGAISIFADDVDIAAGSTLSATGIVSFATATVGRAVDLGTDTAGKLSLTDAELDRVTASILLIGDTNIGAINVSAAISQVNGNGIILTAGTGLNINLTADVTTAGGDLTLANDVILGTSVSLDTTNAGAVPSGAFISVVGAIHLGANTLTWNPGAADTSINADISDTGALIKQGTGKLTLDGVKTYSGGTTISNGTLQTIRTSSAGTGPITLGDANTGASNVEFVLANNTIVEPAQSNAIVVSALGTGTATISDDFFSAGQLDYTGSITLNRATTFREGTNNSTLISGKISGNVGTLTLTGAGGGPHGLFFGNAANSFVGDVLITGGANAVIFGVSVAGSIPDTSSVTVNGTFLLDGVSETIDALNGSGAVQNITGANTLTVGGNGGTGTFSGVISDGSGVLKLIKSGTGAQTISGANTYTGVTNVNGGTLIVSGSLANDVNIASGATLSGTITIGGSVFNSGTVQPGGSGAVGTLTISGNYTQTASGTLAVEVGGINGSDFDQLLVSGVITLDGALNATLINSFVPAQGSSFPVVTASSVIGAFATQATAPLLTAVGLGSVNLVVPVPEVVVSKDPFTFTDADGDKVKVTLTGKGSVNVVLQGGAADHADIYFVELIGTDLTSNLGVAIANKPGVEHSNTTTVGGIFATGALQHVGSITLGRGVTLGDGVADALPDLRVTGKMNTLTLDDIAANAFIKLGEALPYNLPGKKTPDTYNNHPALTIRNVLGPGVDIRMLGADADASGHGSVHGVGGGGFGNVIIGSWAFNGHLRTTQSIGSFLVKTGDFYGVIEVDKFHVGAATTANVGTMSIANGSWGSSGSEVEGTIGVFSAASFLAGATITAGSIGSVIISGAFAGTFILTDPDAAAVPTFTVNSDFSGRVVSAKSIGKLKIKGDFTGSLEAPSIGSITAYAFLGTDGVTDIKTTAGKLGLLTATTGIVRDYTIVSDAAFSGIKVKLAKLGASMVGIDNVHITATSIGSLNVDLSAAKGSTGVNLTGIRNSEFITTATGIVKGTQGSIGKVTVKLKGKAGGDGTGIVDTTFDARVLAGEFGIGLLASTANPIGNVSVSVSGFGGASVGLDGAAFESDVLGTTTVTVTRGTGASTARGVNGATFTADGAIGALSFSGDVTENIVSNLQVRAGGKIAGLNVAAKTTAFGSLVNSDILAGQSLVVAGTDKQQKAALAAATLGAVSIGGSLTNSKLVAGANIAAVTVGANATDALILAGAKLGGDFTLGDGNETFQRAAAITSVTVGGAFTRSSIVAGIASTNATFGDADDALAAVAGTLAQSSSIGALKFGAGSGTNAAAPAIPHAFAIQAAAIKSLANAGSTIVKNFAAALFLDAGAANEDASDVLVRLRS